MTRFQSPSYIVRLVLTGRTESAGVVLSNRTQVLTYLQNLRPDTLAACSEARVYTADSVRYGDGVELITKGLALRETFRVTTQGVQL